MQIALVNIFLANLGLLASEIYQLAIQIMGSPIIKTQNLSTDKCSSNVTEVFIQLW